MQVIENVFTMKKYITTQRSKGRSIGFISTMGYLHQGHIEMIKRSRAENDITVISVFVNIAQFSSTEAYKKFPRDFEYDYRISEEAGADVMFFPETTAILGANSSVFIDIEGYLEGMRSRGLSTVAMKFFSIINPDRAYYSQHNIYELAVAEKMVSELYLEPQIVPCPITREPNGLAIDTENEKLSAQEKDQAILIHMALEYAEMEIKHGERNATHLKREILNYLKDAPQARIKKVSILSYDTFRDSIQIKGKTLITLDIRIGKAHLTDSIIVTV